MGRGISGVKKNVYIAAAVAGIVVLLVFAAGCSGDLLGYIKDMIAQGECKGIIDLPKTGQTTWYATRDDGDLQMGVAWPSPRFTVGTGAESVCITDNLTGLMWDQAPSTTQMDWAGALTYANALDLGGHNDWRLPNRKELRSLVNYEQLNQSVWLNIPTGLFTGVQADFYWSSTTCAHNTTGAWCLIMGYGNVYAIDKTAFPNYYVLAVRAGDAVSIPKTGQTASYYSEDDGDLEMGVAWPDPRFTDNGGGIICDKLTGLMWEQSPSVTQGTWTEAFTYANGLSLDGHSDWRLPNVNELESLINAGQTDSVVWLNGQGFDNLQVGIYWSSTTCAPNTTSAWVIDLGSGNMLVLIHDKTNDNYVLAVRGGE